MPVCLYALSNINCMLYTLSEGQMNELDLSVSLLFGIECFSVVVCVA